VYLWLKQGRNRRLSWRSPASVRHRAAWVCALMLSALAPQSAPAAIAPQLQLGAQERAELAGIEDYLNGIRTVRAEFVQQSSNGEQARGQLYLARPGRLRIDYQPPVPILVVADGSFLIYYDRKLEQVSYVPLASTPASILLDDRISLAEDSLVLTGYERAGDLVLVSVARADNPGEGSITLSFKENPLQLAQWSVTDAQGIVTLVKLVEPQFDIELDRGLFIFQDPRQFTERPVP
jgi:outer membrane lipoprotein-sorting protein